MKRFIIFLVFILSIQLVGCKENITPTEENKVVISYYDSTNLIYSHEYKDTIEIYEYSKTGYEFKGWYLDQGLLIPFDKANPNQYFAFDSLDLFAKTEEIKQEMKELDIQVIGTIENNVVTNPLFTWKNSNNDEGFNLELYKGEQKVLEDYSTLLSFQFATKLDTNTQYKLSITGNKSNKTSSIEFSTIPDYIEITNSITLSNPFSDGMVIQRNKDTLISGLAPAYQLITLEIEDETYYTISNETGYFEFTIPEREKSVVPIEITLSNGIRAKKTIKDILFGDVYLFAGQSNMQWQTIQSDYERDDLLNLVDSNVRFFAQDVTTSTTPQTSVKNGRWFKPNQMNVLTFSAIATITGSLLKQELNDEVPIGIITAYQGDTNIANWMGKEYYTGNCQTKYLHYNAMVYPLKNTNLSGVVWYQGCNNSAAGCEYKDLLLDLFRNYRDIFNNDKLPFFVIGLACYDGDVGNNFDFSYVRESQAKACAEDTRAYFISTCDNGDPTYIHPKAKHYICERVTKSICSVVYHMDYYSEGPTYLSHTIKGNQVIISFANADGLMHTGQIKGLYLAGKDGKYHEATATINGSQIIAYSDKVDNPIYIKYGFGKSPFVNIFNRDGYSLVPFRTDEYNTNIDLLNYDDASVYSFHPDGSKMSVEIVDGNIKITKTKDGKGYGSIRLDKWGAIAYMAEGFRFTVIGTNSGAQITFRAVEGDSSEIWGYKIIDDFTGAKTFNADFSDFICVYNKQNNIFDPQKISYVEVMVESNNEVTFEVSEARFVKKERSAPTSFLISSVLESDSNITVSLTTSLFANDYILNIKDENNNQIYTNTSTDTLFNIEKSLLLESKPYYIYATSQNELGEKNASNSGFVFYLKSDSKLIINNFDYLDEESLKAYIDASMAVHSGLSCSLAEKGIKIVSSGAGWQNFIFKLDTGIADGMKKLEFYADFSNYKGQVVLQLCDPSYTTYNYTIDLTKQNKGTFSIDFNDFKNGSTPFANKTLMWVMFNFNDSVGDGYIILDDVILSK